MLVVDLSPSEQFGTRARPKARVAAEVAALCAFSAIKNNDRVGLILGTEVVERSCRRRRARSTCCASSARSSATSRSYTGTEPEARARDARPRSRKRRSVAFVVSDFFADGFERALALAVGQARRHPGDARRPARRGAARRRPRDLRGPRDRRGGASSTPATRACASTTRTTMRAARRAREALFNKLALDSVMVRTDAELRRRRCAISSRSARGGCGGEASARRRRRCAPRGGAALALPRRGRVRTAAAGVGLERRCGRGRRGCGATDASAADAGAASASAGATRRRRRAGDPDLRRARPGRRHAPDDDGGVARARHERLRGRAQARRSRTARARRCCPRASSLQAGERGRQGAREGGLRPPRPGRAARAPEDRRVRTRQGRHGADDAHPPGRAAAAEARAQRARAAAAADRRRARQQRARHPLHRAARDRGRGSDRERARPEGASRTRRRARSARTGRSRASSPSACRRRSRSRSLGALLHRWWSRRPEGRCPRRRASRRGSTALAELERIRAIEPARGGQAGRVLRPRERRRPRATSARATASTARRGVQRPRDDDRRDARAAPARAPAHRGAAADQGVPRRLRPREVRALHADRRAVPGGARPRRGHRPRRPSRSMRLAPPRRLAAGGARREPRPARAVARRRRDARRRSRSGCVYPWLARGEAWLSRRRGRTRGRSLAARASCRSSWWWGTFGQDARIAAPAHRLGRAARSRARAACAHTSATCPACSAPRALVFLIARPGAARLACCATRTATRRASTSCSCSTSPARCAPCSTPTRRTCPASPALAEGKRLTRIDTAKVVVRDFIARRKTDRIGVVVFGKSAFVLSPPTLDYHLLDAARLQDELGVIDGNATAIGDAVGTAVARLRRSDAQARSSSCSPTATPTRA